MRKTTDFINKLLDILHNLKTNGNPHPTFLELTKLVAKNWNLSELFLLIHRSFSGNKPEQLSYWLYSSKQSNKPKEGKKHNIIEISYKESCVLKETFKNTGSVLDLKQDNYLLKMLNDMTVDDKIDLDSPYYGFLIRENQSDACFLIKDSDKKTLDDPDWILVKKIICLMIDKIINAYNESNKIKNVLSETAHNLLKIQNLNTDQDDALQGVLDTTRKAVKAEMGALFLVDSSGSSLVLERASSDIKLEYEKIPQVPTYLIENYNPEKKKKGVTPWVWFRKEPFNARDFFELTHNSEGHHKGNWDDLMYGDKDKVKGAFKCVYMTPLLAKDECIGVLKYENRTKDAQYEYFDQADERTIDITAQFIANLVISQRIEKNRYDNALPEISTTLVSSFGNPDFYDELLEKSRSILSAQICSLFLVDKDQSLKLKAIVGVTDDIKIKLKKFSYSNYLESKGLTPWILKENKSFNVRTFADLKARSFGHHWGQWDKIVYHSKPDEEFKSLYSIPLKIGTEPIGVLKVENKETTPYYFTESDERLFDLIGRLLAIAVKYENIQYQLTNMARVADIGFLASGIAHEFNNYLQSFITNIGLIKLESVKSINQPIKDLENGVFMAARVIKNFWQIRERKSEVITFDVDKLMNELFELSHDRFLTNRVELSYENNLTDKFLSFNQADIQTIIINLLSNAYESITENKSSGQIDITLNESKYDLIIEIEDSGIGINKKDLNRVFSPFYSSRRETKGMGVGLFWVQQIVTQKGGEINVNGKNRKGGATFTVTFPKNN